MDAMREEQAKVNATEKLGMADLFRGELFWPMFIAIMMMCAQQFSGINVAMFFSTMIFEGQLQITELSGVWLDAELTL